MEVEKGNIDIYKRPLVKMEDGGTGTVRSITVEMDGTHYNLPKIHPEGHVMSDPQAIEYFKTTGQHLGAYDDKTEAEAAAEALHKQQEIFYGLGGQLDE